jgi:GNAT superfamily N-acetyltransferase
MTNAKIVSASTPSELALVRELLCEYAESHGLNLCFQNFDEELLTLPGKYAEPRGRLYLVFDGADAAACGALRMFNNHIAEMKRLYVRPQFRKRGYGRVLSEKLISEARTIGYNAIYLDTLSTMSAARALYAALGFVETDPYYDNPLPGVCYLKLELQASQST